MARVQVPITVLDTTGAPISGASVRVQFRAGGADATLYSGESGGSTTTNPTSTDSVGRVQAWVDRGAYNAVISGTGFTTYTQPFDAAPAADSSVDNLWIPAAVIDDRELDPTNITSFLKLATVADRKVAFGVFNSGSFSNTAKKTGTTAHGLAVVPVLVLMTAGAIATQTPSSSAVAASWDGTIDATSFGWRLDVADNGITNNGVNVYWLAIG